jgi:hypothetical protein
MSIREWFQRTWHDWPGGATRNPEPPPKSPYDEAVEQIAAVAALRQKELEAVKTAKSMYAGVQYTQKQLDRMIDFTGDVRFARQDLECAKIRVARMLKVGTLTVETLVVLYLRKALSHEMFLHVLRLDRMGRCPRPVDLLTGSTLIPSVSEA